MDRAKRPSSYSTSKLCVESGEPIKQKREETNTPEINLLANDDRLRISATELHSRIINQTVPGSNTANFITRKELYGTQYSDNKQLKFMGTISQGRIKKTTPLSGKCIIGNIKDDYINLKPINKYTYYKKIIGGNGVTICTFDFKTQSWISNIDNYNFLDVTVVNETQIIALESNNIIMAGYYNTNSHTPKWEFIEIMSIPNIHCFQIVRIMHLNNTSLLLSDALGSCFLFEQNDQYNPWCHHRIPKPQSGGLEFKYCITKDGSIFCYDKDKNHLWELYIKRNRGEVRFDWKPVFPDRVILKISFINQTILIKLKENTLSDLSFTKKEVLVYDSCEKSWSNIAFHSADKKHLLDWAPFSEDMILLHYANVLHAELDNHTSPIVLATKLCGKWSYESIQIEPIDSHILWQDAILLSDGRIVSIEMVKKREEGKNKAHIKIWQKEHEKWEFALISTMETLGIKDEIQLYLAELYPGLLAVHNTLGSDYLFDLYNPQPAPPIE